MRISKQALIDAANTAIKADAAAEAEHPAKVAAAKVDARAEWWATYGAQWLAVRDMITAKNKKSVPITERDLWKITGDTGRYRSDYTPRTYIAPQVSESFKGAEWRSQIATVVALLRASDAESVSPRDLQEFGIDRNTVFAAVAQ